jgi:hypothetical protein
MENDNPPTDASMKYSLGITAGFLLVLVLLGLWLRPTEESDVEKDPLRDASSKPTPEITLPQPRVSVKTMQDQLVLLPDCRVMPAEDNDGDSFWVATSQGNFRFKPYFVDAPDVLGSGATDTKQLMDYFNMTSEEAIRSLAKEGKKMIPDQQLMSRELEVLTRWEQAPEECTNGVTTYRAFVVLLDEHSQPVNLANLLVQNGLARIDTTCTQQLPNNRPASDYLQKLTRLESESKAQKRGGWHQARVQQINHVAR